MNNGLPQLGEVEQVQEVFARHFGMPLVSVDVSDTFLDRLEDVTDPEEKRNSSKPSSMIEWE